ncbi:hypothetical protein FRX31_015654 [Thalictrum thalictroides]|uniref:Uncharacterized protein n=1 Tax=Thalictrum thalictroides TaxID=46969 RepID=A0A7J6WBL4_THATH|nr:hypothetical protein FRX31_015654 [Thalictrum thalictroides]
MVVSTSAYEILFESIKDLLSNAYTIKQLKNKVRKLREKYDKLISRVKNQNEKDINTLKGSIRNFYKIKGTGLDRLLDISKNIRSHLPLVSAIVEHYNATRRCFEFGRHTLVLTLEDVLHITGLPVNGKLVTGIIDGLARVLCPQYLGINYDANSRSGDINLKWLKENFEKLFALIRIPALQHKLLGLKFETPSVFPLMVDWSFLLDLKLKSSFLKNGKEEYCEILDNLHDEGCGYLPNSGSSLPVGPRTQRDMLVKEFSPHRYLFQNHVAMFEEKVNEWFKDHEPLAKIKKDLIASFDFQDGFSPLQPADAKDYLVSEKNKSNRY